jgi:hypothetical protein
MNKQKPQVLTYTSIFCLKRLLLAVFTVFFNNSLVLNILMNIFGNLAVIKYLLDSMPMEFTYLNWLEIINEINMLFFTYVLFLFTQFVPDLEIRYQLGYVFIYLVSFVMGLNLMLISKSMYQDSMFEYSRKKSQ